MAYFHTPKNNPWKGSPNFVKVKGRSEVGRVLGHAESVGDLRCLRVHFESTGEVCFYTTESVTRCDENGDVQAPI